MVLGLEDAVTILSKWKDDSAHALVVSESPFQQSRRGIPRDIPRSFAGKCF
jgi:hypothetical protein